jgi:hypothetical protein
MSSSVRRSKEGLVAMIAPLGTLAFLATLWLIVVLGASVLEASGARIAAALKGKSSQRHVTVPVRLRTRSRLQQPMRARPRWRDAA